MKKVFVLIAVAFMAISVNAQNWGLGVKAGWDYGLNIKKYNGGTNLEGVIDFHHNGFRALGLYEWDNELGSGFHIYYGLGANIGVWDNDKDESGFGLGINGVIGIEWHLPNNIPLTLALDWTPSFELIPDSDFYSKGLGFSVKYVW
ncbi:MAG: hypothetical protein IJ681_10820 [Bacteroidales bacterium]|nr:hypothetical protein [Bacteroidales bacterium]